ncbi:MAG: LamG domain-containing protein [Myxococcota bacterium]
MFPPTSHLLCAFVAALCLGSSAQAVTLGYWRMETDLEPSAEGLRVPNEVLGGNDLLSSSAFVDSNLPTTSVPQTGTPNNGSLGGTRQGGSAGINGSVVAYAALNSPSLTVEFWGRTVENDADLFLRTTGNNGLRIGNPSSLDVVFWVDDGAGGASPLQMLNLFDMDANWHHFAFMYDAGTGLGQFFVDGGEVGRVQGAAGRALYWDPSAPVEIGVRMDYAAAFNGTIDEVRIDGDALGASSLLLAPEPKTVLLMGAGLGALAWVGRKRRRPSTPCTESERAAASLA